MNHLYAKNGIYDFRIFGFFIQFKTPRSRPLFSERRGSSKPLLGNPYGYRIYAGRLK